jgi:HD-GYP domain-containing protein (c-di-GMP phosphodiesterase class II)
LTTERPYKPALHPDQAVRELREEAAQGWKFEAIVEEFAALAVQGDFALTLADAISTPHLQRWRRPI